MKVTKEEIYGLIGSAIFLLAIALILYFSFLHTKIKAEEGGVWVNFGTVDWASGTFEPKPENEYKKPTERIDPTAETPGQQNNQPVITQDYEQTASVDSADKEKAEREKAEAERLRLADEKRKQKEAEERRQREAINRQISGAFGAGETPHSNQGSASDGAGNQGSSQGNAPTGNYSGIGGTGDFDLNGRSLGAGGLQRPAYAAQEEGTIVVEITVDSKGNVINAEIRLRGTNIENQAMRRSALEAAGKTKFNAISGIQNQIGSITYRYSLK
ncbi:MAG: TonB family protein [Dysgonamonadaceae bacterium]|jgi:TonB family protein|nr:TonB family protein [Dysgonamonadaceae bacterium]